MNQVLMSCSKTTLPSNTVILQDLVFFTNDPNILYHTSFLMNDGKVVFNCNIYNLYAYVRQMV